MSSGHMSGLLTVKSVCQILCEFSQNQQKNNNKSTVTWGDFASHNRQG